MQINSGGRKIEVRGDEVFVDGKRVPAEEGKSSGGAQTEASKKAKEALEERYPGVAFRGDCSKVTIDEKVVLEPGVTIEQNDKATIEISGESVLKEGAHISTPASTDVSLSTVSISGRGRTVISTGGGVSISTGGMSINSSSDPGRVIIENCVIGQHSEVTGLSIELSNTEIADKCRVLCEGSGDIEISDSQIAAQVHCSGSGDISIDDSKIGAPVQCAGSGDIDIKNSSTVNGRISVAGSGDVTVSGGTIEPSASLSVAGSGDIKVKNSTVSTSHSVAGSKSVRL